MEEGNHEFRKTTGQPPEEWPETKRVFDLREWLGEVQREAAQSFQEQVWQRLKSQLSKKAQGRNPLIGKIIQLFRKK